MNGSSEFNFVLMQGNRDNMKKDKAGSRQISTRSGKMRRRNNRTLRKKSKTKAAGHSVRKGGRAVRYYFKTEIEAMSAVFGNSGIASDAYCRTPNVVVPDNQFPIKSLPADVSPTVNKPTLVTSKVQADPIQKSKPATNKAPKIADHLKGRPVVAGSVKYPVSKIKQINPTSFDIDGDPVKFRYSPEYKALIPDRPARKSNIEPDWLVSFRKVTGGLQGMVSFFSHFASWEELLVSAHNEVERPSPGSILAPKLAEMITRLEWDETVGISGIFRAHGSRFKPEK